MKDKLDKLTTAQIIIISFAATIILGTILLMLPMSTNGKEMTSFIDALFTATSATCVTGLIVQDTATYWSSLGQLIILILIQIGGMGVITVVGSISVLSGRKIHLKQRSTIQEAILAPKMGGIVRFTRFVVKTVICIEIVGAICMLPVFVTDFGIKGIWYSLFHSISAFCNAGFDLMGIVEPYSSLTHYASNIIINIVICSLIVIGGIGFLTWEDLKTNKFHFRKYRLQTKIILVFTAFLVGISGIYFFFFEFNGIPLEKRILLSIFQAITPRTAGFNTANLNAMHETGVLWTIVLMLVGASPGSTAGGMKITTFAVMVCTVLSILKREEHTHLFRRRISHEIIRNAVSIATLYVSLSILSSMILSRVEHLPLLTCLFEVASAIGTVGLTLGITPSLSILSKIILIILMFVGRVGTLTLMFSFLSSKKGSTARLPQEKIFIG